MLDLAALVGIVERGAKPLTLIHSDGHAYAMRITRIPATVVDLLAEGVVRLPMAGEQLHNQKKDNHEEQN